MSSFYKMDPAAWDFGTVKLTLEQEAAYLRIVNAIHKHDAPVPYNDRVIAGLFRCSTRKARTLVEDLIEAGKVTVEDGCLWNERARSEMVHRQLATGSAQVRGSKGGRTRANNAAKALESKETDQATASTRIEENRIELQQPREASQIQTDRERLLTAMGADPVSGLIGPNGTRLGSVADMAEVEKWDSLGIKPDDQCRLIAERCAAMRRKTPAWAPRSFGYFSGLMADFAASRSSPVPNGQAAPVAKPLYLQIAERPERDFEAEAAERRARAAREIEEASAAARKALGA